VLRATPRAGCCFFGVPGCRAAGRTPPAASTPAAPSVVARASRPFCRGAPEPRPVPAGRRREPRSSPATARSRPASGRPSFATAGRAGAATADRSCRGGLPAAATGASSSVRRRPTCLVAAGWPRIGRRGRPLRSPAAASAAVFAGSLRVGRDMAGAFVATSAQFTPEVDQRLARSPCRWWRWRPKRRWRHRRRQRRWWWWHPMRWGRWRRQRHPCRRSAIAASQRVAADDRHLVATPVHALHVTLVVTLLQGVTRGISGRGTADAAGQEAEPGTNRSAAGAIDCRTHRGADCGSQDGAGGRRIDHRACRRLRADRAPGVGPADLVVEAELFESPPRSRQGHDRRPFRRQADTGAERQGCKQRRVTMAGHEWRHGIGDTGGDTLLPAPTLPGARSTGFITQAAGNG